ncbi:MAG: HAD family phosphatase [Roseivirga sp.]|nr:HAD family phosphatase [Roseivirga sp.]
MPDIRNLDAIIFDLGGVLLNIDHQAPVRAFAELGIPNFDELYSKAVQSTLFTDLETGKLSPQAFRERLRDYLPMKLPDEVLDKAWNSILLDFRPGSIRFLEQLKGKRRTFLLSNTNAIHHAIFSSRLQLTYGYSDISELMEKAYYSHEVGMRKPHARIFEHVINESQLNPKRTLFIDDSEEHILTAQNLGLQTHHLQDDETIEELLKELI